VTLSPAWLNTQAKTGVRGW